MVAINRADQNPLENLRPLERAKVRKECQRERRAAIPEEMLNIFSKIGIANVLIVILETNIPVLMATIDTDIKFNLSLKNFIAFPPSIKIPTDIPDRLTAMVGS